MVTDRSFNSSGMNDSQLDVKQQRLLQEVMKLSSSYSNSNSLNEFKYTAPATPPPIASSTPSTKKSKNVKVSSNVKPVETSVSTPATESKKKQGKLTPAKGNSLPTIKTSQSNTSLDMHFSGSAYENSPDASQLPLPAFDEELPEFFSAGGTIMENKTVNKTVESSLAVSSSYKCETLKRYLKLRAP